MNKVVLVQNELTDKEKFTKMMMYQLGFSEFQARRVVEIAYQFGIYATQAGRVPEPSALITMAVEHEKELDNCIGADLVGRAIASLRKESGILPTLAKINKEALHILNITPKAITKEPIREIHEEDQWADLAAHRLLLRSSTLLKVSTTHYGSEYSMEHFGRGIPDPSPWIKEKVTAEPTTEEAWGFCRMICRESPHNRTYLAQFWGQRNPYGLTTNDIKAFIRSLLDSQGGRSQAWDLPY